MLLGSLAVFQPVLNRMVFLEKGMGFGIVLNSVTGLLSIVCFLTVFWWIQKTPDALQFKIEGRFYWWFLLPGVMGLLVVSFVPLMIKHLGAFPTIAAMLFGQIVTSFLYDTLVLGYSFDTSRLIGILLTGTGAYLSFKAQT